MPFDPHQVYYWRLKGSYQDRYGDPCHVVSANGRGTCEVVFGDGLRVMASWVGLRKTPPEEWTENGIYEPTAEEIAAECARIQAGWPHPDAHCAAEGERVQHWTPETILVPRTR